MEESVLTSTKKILGISPTDGSFDLDVITHINSSIDILRQVGLTASSYVEDDSTLWSDVFGSSTQMQLIKTCIYLQVRLLFDPPTTSFLLSAAQAQVQEHIWRLNVEREDTEWVDPDPPGVVADV